jgi:hypothetical protein
MKKINFILLIIISQLLINCSKSDSTSTTSPSTNSSFSMKLNAVNCLPATPTTNSVLYWDKVTNNDGTHYYKIVVLFKRNGISSNLPDDINFKLNTENLSVNQIFTATSELSPSNPIDLLMIQDGGSQRLYKCNSNSTGQIKITQFDGVTMSGEFSFGNLKEMQNYATIPYINITDGVFTNIPKKN